MKNTKKKLGELLVDSGLITQDTLDKALILQKKTGEKLGELLVTQGFITDLQILDAMKRQLGIRDINLKNINLQQNIISILPENLARKYDVLPIDIVNGKLVVVMADPLNYFAIEEIRAATGYVVDPVIALRQDILDGMDRYYSRNTAMHAAESYIKNYKNKNFNLFDRNDEDDDTSTPVIQFIDTIIENATFSGASDIHIEPDEKEMRIRFRIDGILREILRTDIEMLDPVISRLKIMSDLNIAEKRIPQDGRILFTSKQRTLDIRISSTPTIWGEKIVMRILDKTNFHFEMDKLGLDIEDELLLKNIIKNTHGILLVSGPTGSGKTTTIYSILNLLNDVSKNILTIEDPVEYNFKGINQMQVNNKIGFTFASALKNILRQDPDIILVGEIRDAETAEMAVRSALTGHVVLSTIHTNNALGTIARLKNMDIEPFLMSSTIIGLVAQRLIRKVCPNCVEHQLSSASEMKLLNITEPITLCKAKSGGCSICSGSGYKGRVAVFEIISVDKDIKEAIASDLSEIDMEALIKKKNMPTLKNSCIKKILSGVTTIDEMLRIVYEY